MTTAPNLERQYTPDDLLEFDEGGFYELDEHGRLVELNMGAESDSVALRIMTAIEIFLRHNPIGWTSGPTGLQIFPATPRKLRRPDGLFIRWDRTPDRKRPKGHLTVAPDLVVESVSPHDTVDELNRKIIEYQSAGIRLIWVAHPGIRTIDVYGAGGSGRFGPDDHLDGGDVLPGFSVRVSDLIPEDVADPSLSPISAG